MRYEGMEKGNNFSIMSEWQIWDSGSGSLLPVLVSIHFTVAENLSLNTPEKSPFLK